MAGPRRTRSLPSRQEILDFIAASPTPVDRRAIAKAFKVTAGDRVALKGLIKDVERSGPAESSPPEPERPRAPATLPTVAIIEISAIDDQGEPVCRIVGARLDADLPEIRLVPGRGEAALAIGDRAVARLRPMGCGRYAASVVRKIERETERVLGVFQRHSDGGGFLTPTDRRNKTVYQVKPGGAEGAETGDVILAMPLTTPRLGSPSVQMVETVGKLDDPRAISLVAVHAHSIPVAFSAAALAEAAAARPVELGTRSDLRAIPLVTIDGADARDFDDAVWAEPDPEVDGGWHILVAIADVAWYVRPGSALDKSAIERGNSVYFPDRVVPMLPEALSNELCSLKPDVERACMAIHMWIDADGRTTRRAVVRGLMRSVARLTYEEVQAAMEGGSEGRAAELRDTVIEPLYGAFRALERARRQRGTLDLDLPERRIVLAPDGSVERIGTRLRLDSHRLIEEFMISANVAAAETLGELKRPCMYRVHDVPATEKLESLRQCLESLGIPGLKLARGQTVRPRHFAQILERAEGRPEAPLINELVLRSQAQAAYSPENLGHFGLALRQYAHFTSPIRRYADLLVHRELISGLGLGDGAAMPSAPADLVKLGADLSACERRATLAERTANDRYVAAYMRGSVGATFTGRVTGVARYGLFVGLTESGAEGLLPVSALPAEYYRHDPVRQCLVGERSGRTYSLGQTIEVRLRQVEPISAALVFALDGEDGVTGFRSRDVRASRNGPKPSRPRRRPSP